MEIIYVREVRTCDEPPDIVDGQEPMFGEHVHHDRWGCPGDGPGESALTELSALLDTHKDHPLRTLAAHVADLFVAAETTCLAVKDGDWTASDFDAMLPHLCREHVRAAAILLACLKDADGAPNEGRLTFGIRWVKTLLGAD